MELLIYVLLLLFVFASCDDDDVNNPDPPNEEEVITTVELTFTPAGGAPLVFIWKDSDGPGGNPPEQEDDIVSPARCLWCDQYGGCGD